MAQDKLSWRGQDLYDNDGGKVGKIEEIYLDADTDQPEWALVNTGMFGSKQTFIPIRDASVGDQGPRVPYDKSLIKDAPKMDADGRLSQEEESNLYRHYGMDYSEARSDSGLPEGGATGGVDVDRDHDRVGTGRGVVGNDVSGPETDDAMTRSEEELRVGTRERETGRVRLRKYITTENVTQTVPVQREEVRVEREAITDANIDAATSGKDLSEEEHEVTLRSEEAVVQKNVVPKERVRVDKDVITEQQQVSEELRKEQIEVEGDGVTDVDRDRDRTDRI
jgi:uncharacterized protein (TIGR02271 family)